MLDLALSPVLLLQLLLPSASQLLSMFTATDTAAANITDTVTAGLHATATANTSLLLLRPSMLLLVLLLP